MMNEGKPKKRSGSKARRNRFNLIGFDDSSSSGSDSSHASASSNHRMDPLACTRRTEEGASHREQIKPNSILLSSFPNRQPQTKYSVSFPPPYDMITSINTRPRTQSHEMPKLYYSSDEIKNFKREYGKFKNAVLEEMTLEEMSEREKQAMMEKNRKRTQRLGSLLDVYDIRDNVARAEKLEYESYLKSNVHNNHNSSMSTLEIYLMKDGQDARYEMATLRRNSDSDSSTSSECTLYSDSDESDQESIESTTRESSSSGVDADSNTSQRILSSMQDAVLLLGGMWSEDSEINSMHNSTSLDLVDSMYLY
mmetsp:Transcript_11966/g.20778  ORF Transcript_11966/g.20778 Transcript_11966/m.20778 type:complete len:309 (+) Transcript_11966:176-1102(+)